MGKYNNKVILNDHIKGQAFIKRDALKSVNLYFCSFISFIKLLIRGKKERIDAVF